MLLSALGLFAFALGAVLFVWYLDRRAQQKELTRLDVIMGLDRSSLKPPRPRYPGVPERHKLS
jgi:hypothetical protein